MDLNKAKLSLDAADKISDKKWTKLFPVERYKEEGPDKHEQEDEAIPTSIMGMYEGWACELCETHNLDEEDKQLVRFLCERLVNCVSYGMMGPPSESDWDVHFEGTLGYWTVTGLTQTTKKGKPDPDKDIVNQILDQIKEPVRLLLQAGVSFEQISQAVMIVPVEDTHVE